eukprot:6409142-Alexandrium_andersonii.AAC.1
MESNMKSNTLSIFEWHFGDIKLGKPGTRLVPCGKGGGPAHWVTFKSTDEVDNDALLAQQNALRKAFNVQPKAKAANAATQLLVAPEPVAAPTQPAAPAAPHVKAGAATVAPEPEPP